MTPNKTSFHLTRKTRKMSLREKNICTFWKQTMQKVYTQKKCNLILSSNGPKLKPCVHNAYLQIYLHSLVTLAHYYLVACSGGRRKFGGLPRLPLEEPVTPPGRDSVEQLVPWPVPCHFSTITRVLVAENHPWWSGWVTWTFLGWCAWWKGLDIQPSFGSWKRIMLRLLVRSSLRNHHQSLFKVGLISLKVIACATVLFGW